MGDAVAVGGDRSAGLSGPAAARLVALLLPLALLTFNDCQTEILCCAGGEGTQQQCRCRPDKTSLVTGLSHALNLATDFTFSDHELRGKLFDLTEYFVCKVRHRHDNGRRERLTDKWLPHFLDWRDWGFARQDTALPNCTNLLQTISMSPSTHFLTNLTNMMLFDQNLALDIWHK